MMMRTLLGLLACAIVSGPVLAQDDRVDPEGVKTLVGAFSSAWGQHDAAAMAALWVADGDLVNPTQRVAQGAAEIEALFRDEHTSYMKGTTLAVTVTRSRALGPGLALIDCDADLGGVKNAPTLKHLIFAVVRQTEGRWRFVAVRLSVPVPPPPKDR
jgi:uncharacterized protein (TIGR02246 family)